MICDPDGFLGAVMASQSVHGLKAMINGPGGCRSRTMNYLRETLQEYRGDDSCCCRSKYTGRVSMLPCTHLNADDIILGSGAKITDGLKSIIHDTGADVVLIDTLGATVQVVDREDAVAKTGYSDKIILANEDLSNLTFTEGFDDMMTRIVSYYVKEKLPIQKLTVNILGYTQMDISWEYGKMELEHILSLLGVKINTFIGCDCSPEDLRKSVSAELNIVLRPEYSIETARFMEDRFGIPFFIPSQGTPIGFESIRSFISEISELMGTESAAALSEMGRAELHMIKVIQNYDRVANNLRATSMALHGLGSDIVPMMKYLYDYLNTVPKSVVIKGRNSSYDDNRVEEYLAEIGHSEALDAPVPVSNLRIFLSDGYSAESYSEKNPYSACIGIITPFIDTVPLSNRCLIGIMGTYNLMDSILNGLPKFTCGQPTAADFR